MDILDLVDVELGMNAYELKCTILDIKPPIWRRLRVPGQITLGNLHNALQTAFDWEDSHLHSFNVDGVEFSRIDEEDNAEDFEDEDNITLNELDLTRKSKILYTYDFGDDWEVQIKVEKVENNDPDLTSPVCLDGARAAPPDDCGGVPGYYGLVEAAVNPKHPKHEDLVEWLGYQFDPEEFDIDEINEGLGEITPKIGLPIPWIDRAAERIAKSAADDAAPAPTDSEWKALFEASHRCLEAAPWRWLGPDLAEFIQNPETGENAIYVVSGEDSELSGITLYRGERGFDTFWRISGIGIVDDTDVLAIQDSTNVIFTAKKALEDEDIERFKSLKLRYTGKSAWPFARAFDPGYTPRQLNGAEARFLTLALYRIIEIAAAHKQHIREVMPLEQSGAAPLHILEDGVWRIESYEPKFAEINIPTTLPTENIINDLLNLTMSDGVLEVDFWSIPQPLFNGAGHEMLTFAITASDAASVTPAGMEMAKFDELLDKTLNLVVGVLIRIEMRPSVIRVRRPELAALLTPLANRIECRVTLTPLLGATEIARLTMLAKVAGIDIQDLEDL